MIRSLPVVASIIVFATLLPKEAVASRPDPFQVGETLRACLSDSPAAADPAAADTKCFQDAFKALEQQLDVAKRSLEARLPASRHASVYRAHEAWLESHAADTALIADLYGSSSRSPAQLALFGAMVHRLSYLNGLLELYGNEP